MYDQVIEEARAAIAQKYGIAWYKKLFFKLLKHRKLMDFLARLGFIFKSCGFEAVPEKNAMLSRFKLPIIKAKRLLRSFLNSYDERMHFGGQRQVAIFIGCMANYAYTEVGDSLLYVLKKLRINALIPKEQLCCAAPAYFTGDTGTVIDLIKHNIAYFETFADKVEAILIPEATCSSMIIHDWPRILAEEPDWLKRAQPIIQKCHIATEWLYKATDLESVLAAKEKKGGRPTVTYHDPCHSRKTQGVWKEPRRLIGTQYTLKEMSDPNRCCGFGGVTIQSEKFPLAKAAGAPKAAMINATGADVVSAECSACRMQLTDALYQHGGDAVFKHPLELIAEALRS